MVTIKLMIIETRMRRIPDRPRIFKIANDDLLNNTKTARFETDLVYAL